MFFTVAERKRLVEEIIEQFNAQFLCKFNNKYKVYYFFLKALLSRE